MTISSRQNALTVVDIVLELPPFYTLEDIVQFIDEQNLLALFREDIVLEDVRGVKLDLKLMLKDVMDPRSNSCRLIATRKDQLLSQIANEEEQ